MAASVLIDRPGMDRLIAILREQGRTVIGPTLADGAVVLDEVTSIADLPAGCRDEQAGGRYRLERSGGAELFGYTVAAQGWKRFLFVPRRRLWSGSPEGHFEAGEGVATPLLAFLGVRACEMAAIWVQDAVFRDGPYRDNDYLKRRGDAFIIAVACGRAGATCFCESMGTGPAPPQGFDIRLTELYDRDRHAFLAEAGSEAGQRVLAAVPTRPASDSDVRAAAAAVERARAQMQRRMDPDAAGLLKRNIQHPRWAETATRCLSCGNCTLVCPTCFCATTEDVTDLGGTTAERWRRWDSCFALDHSYIHGGAVRPSGAARYRQWITHKLAHWHDQFGMSGCVGCGRCITWCPVGIDITEEVDAIRAGEQGA